jgi:hypothetical protein
MMSRLPSVLVVVTLLLIGCAGTSERARDSEPRAAGLEEIAAAIAGDYVSIRSPADTTEPTALRVVALPHAAGMALELNQRRGSIERVFRLELEPAATPDLFSARFIPLRIQQAASSPACAMSFRLSAGRLVGATDPNECRFQSGERSLGLLKEIAFEGDRVLMADQLMLEDGSPLAVPDRLTLGRVAHFSGTLAQRDGEAWRIARNVSLTSGGNLIEPIDAAGMSLGVLLNLELVDNQEMRTSVLRLQVVDETSGQVKAEVWNAVDSNLIGLALQTLRIELYRQPAILERP